MTDEDIPPIPDNRFRFTTLNTGDDILTQLYLEKAKEGDKFRCWGCNALLNTEDEFIDHFQEHVYEFFKAWPKKEK